jgi:DNA protecting protein DprA
VIGSRRASYEALKTTVDVGLECARSEIGIVSGGAVGCDIAAHEGMLVSGMTNIQAIVVQAGGLVGLFPKSNLGTFSEILLRGGAIISERLWFQAVRPHDFPSRNRIVSGMCEATVVMAAALKSGSLITASEALEQGRDVYVFASGLNDVRFEGSTQLIHDGATPFLSAAELMTILSLNYGDLSLVEPSQQADYCQEDLNVGTFNGGAGGSVNAINGLTNNNYVTQSWVEAILTPVGLVTQTVTSQEEFYTGEYSGSDIIATTGDLSTNNPFRLVDQPSIRYNTTLFDTNTDSFQVFLAANPGSGGCNVFYDRGTLADPKTPTLPA